MKDLKKKDEEKWKMVLLIFPIIDRIPTEIIHENIGSVLKVAYPFISLGRGLHNITEDVDMNSPNFYLLPEFLPMTYKQCAQLKIGIHTDKKGRRSVVKVNVWRSRGLVFYEVNTECFYKSIKKESETIFMGDAKA